MGERGTVRRVSDDLFAAAAADRLSRQAPLASRMRPRTLDEVVGQGHLLGSGQPARRLIEADGCRGDPLGPAGHGQDHPGRARRQPHRTEFVALSAVTAGGQGRTREIARARRLGERARARSCSSTRSIGSTRPSRTPSCPRSRSGLLTLIGATTENPFFEVNPPLLSRSTLFRLEPLDDADLPRWSSAGLAAERAEAAPEPSTTGRPRRRRRPPGAHGAGGGRRPRPAGATRRAVVDLGRRRGGPRPGAPLRRGRALRRDQRVHQEQSGDRTPMPGCTGWPACWRRVRTPASSPAGS